MLISKDIYRDMYLDGKDAQTVRGEIKKLKSEIERLKYKMESPSYPYETHPFPTERDQLGACVGYLSEARRALVSLGEEDELTDAEIIARDFFNNLDSIRKISLTIGTYLDSFYEVRVYPDRAVLTRVARGIESVEISLDRANFLKEISDLDIGMWRDCYLPEQYGTGFSEPLRWRLLVEYNDGIAPRFYEGNGVFPHDFSQLCRLLGVDEY